MKKVILSVWVLLWMLSYGIGRMPSWAHEVPGTRKFPEGYMESTAGAGLVLFFTGDLKGNFEPCG